MPTTVQENAGLPNRAVPVMHVGGDSVHNSAGKCRLAQLHSTCGACRRRQCPQQCRILQAPPISQQHLLQCPSERKTGFNQLENTENQRIPSPTHTIQVKLGYSPAVALALSLM
jgi:hypothetical protein